VPVTDLELAERVLQTWDFTDLPGSRARFEQAAAAEPDETRRQVLVTQVARTHGLEKAFDAGHAVLDGLGDAAGLAAEPAVRVLLERGRLHNTAGDPAGAAPLFAAAYERAEAAGLIGLAADAAHMLAIALPAEQHEEWARRGMALAESPRAAGDPLARTMLAALLNNLAWDFADAGRWADALPLFERAVGLRRERGDAEPLRVARWSRARALRAVGRYAEALAEQRALAAGLNGADGPFIAEEIAANEAALAAEAGPPPVTTSLHE
jgi:tetratricopeptide (TPR) repeat protein